MNLLISEKFIVRSNDVQKIVIGVQKIVIGGLVTCIFVLLVLAGAREVKIQSLSRSVDRYRSDLEYSRRANERYAETFARARTTNAELGECLSKHVSTLSQLREQLAEVRARCEQIETIFENVADLDDSGNGLDGFDFGRISGSDQCTMK